MRDLDTFKRVQLGILPTPLYKLENMSRALGKNLFIKRDDMTGVSLGGNKVRKLEYLLYDAVEQGCDTVITTGGAQSNHAMLTAACCNKLGLSCRIVLKGRGVTARRGNLLLNDLLGVPVQLVDTDDYADVYAAIDAEKTKLEREGHKVYVIPVGGSVPLGSLGYVRCMKEVEEQTSALGVKLDHIICCAGSGGTHAGVALGAELYLPGTLVTGVAVSDEPFEEMVAELTAGAAALLETNARPEVSVKYCVGEGYAIPSPEGTAAIRLLAEKEGIILDPVYTGKTFGGLIQLAKEGYFDGEENLLFLHSGGAGGLFAIDF